MENIDKILDFVRKTNPEMTADELLKRMTENKLFSTALVKIAISKPL